MKYLATPLANVIARVTWNQHMRLPPILKRLIPPLRKVARIYLLVILVIAALQRYLIYQPTRDTEQALLSEARNLGVEPWRDRSGQIIGWKSGRKLTGPAKNRLVVFQGNAGFALHRLHFIEGFEHLENGHLWEVYLFEYPGYGARPGTKSEASFKKAGTEAIQSLQAEDSRSLYLLGESLGSGMACAMAHDFSDAVSGVFLVTPFTRLADAGEVHFPFLPVKLILRDHWDNVTALAPYRKPVAVLLAEKDTVVPMEIGKRLFQATNEPKRVWIMPGVDHNELDIAPQLPWWQEVSDFLLQRNAESGRD